MLSLIFISEFIALIKSFIKIEFILGITINTIFVGIDDHSESGLPSFGDCFGAGCEEEVESTSDSVDEGYEKYIPLLMVISAIGLIGVTISLINEKNSEEE